MMNEKFVEFSDYNTAGLGFGNQLRAFLKSIIISEITKRKLIVTNYWINKLFLCPYHDKWNRGIKKNKLTVKKINNSNDYKNKNFNKIKEDIIEIGGGDLPIGDIISNIHHKESKIIQEILTDKYSFFRKTFMFYLQQPKKDFIDKSKKIVDFDNVEYVTLQFRAFFDVAPSRNKTIHLLDEFIDNFINVVKEKKLELLPVFVTTDKKDVTKKIKNRLQKELNSKFIETKYKFGHSAHSKDIETLCDWLVLGKSKFIYTTGTTYATTSSLIYNDNCIIYNNLNNNRILRDKVIKSNI